MNCLSDSAIREPIVCASHYRLNGLLLLCLACCAACGAPASEPKGSDKTADYNVVYTVRPIPGDGVVTVALRLKQSRSTLRELTMQPNKKFSEFAGDGTLTVDGGTVRWLPPADGGVLSWQVRVKHRRSNNGHDAWLGSEWGLFRAEDIIPRATTRTLKGARSNTLLRFELPDRWSVVSQYYGHDLEFRVVNPKRRFDQPSGWIVMGIIGVRRETIAGTRVTIAGPTKNAVRRLDTLALLNWTMPELARVVPDLPPRITVVSAADPMWRGGLSAPQSLYIHAERPLISENATSTLLHEVMHLSLGVAARPNYDWIVEGLAEYYSLQLLKRSGTISESRFRAAMRNQAKWAREASSLCTRTSTGATTALAVTLMSRLDREIRDATKESATLDDVVRQLWHVEAPVDLALLAGIAERVAGVRPDTLRIDNLPGCGNVATAKRDT